MLQYRVRAHDVEYLRVNGAPLLARIYQPEGQGPFPALLDVHGGAWRAMDRLLNSHIDAALASSGVVVAAIDFRQAPAYHYPTEVQEVNYATRWLKAHAAELDADPQTVGCLGTSSGGHLAMLSAMRPNDARYAALPLAEGAGVDASLAYVAAIFPILDPYARYLWAKETGRDTLVEATDGFFLTTDAMREGNPQLILERGEPVRLPPALIMQGTGDSNVTPAMQERFVAAYAAAGGTAKLELFADAPHGFTLTPGPDTDRALGLIDEFVSGQVARLQAAPAADSQ